MPLPLLERVFSFYVILNITNLYSFTRVVSHISLLHMGMIMVFCSALYLLFRASLATRIALLPSMMLWLFLLIGYPLAQDLYTLQEVSKETLRQMGLYVTLLSGVVWCSQVTLFHIRRVIAACFVISILGFLLNYLIPDQFDFLSDRAIVKTGRAHGWYAEPILGGIFLLFQFIFLDRTSELKESVRIMLYVLLCGLFIFTGTRTPLVAIFVIAPLLFLLDYKDGMQFISTIFERVTVKAIRTTAIALIILFATFWYREPLMLFILEHVPASERIVWRLNQILNWEMTFSEGIDDHSIELRKQFLWYFLNLTMEYPFTGVGNWYFPLHVQKAGGLPHSGYLRIAALHGVPYLLVSLVLLLAPLYKRAHVQIKLHAPSLDLIFLVSTLICLLVHDDFYYNRSFWFLYSVIYFMGMISAGRISPPRIKRFFRGAASNRYARLIDRSARTYQDGQKK